ncbi:MAG: glycosyltransferase [bacterium]
MSGSVVGMLAWCWVIWRLMIGSGWEYRAEFENESSHHPPVSIVVPARNEENNIKECLPTLLNQEYPEKQIIVVNDRSTDQTGDVLNSFDHPDLEVVDGKQRPDESWTGKSWAVHQGLQRAEHDWYLFTDADMEFRPGLLKGALGEASQNKNQLYSLMPVMPTPGILNKILLPLMGLILAVLFPLSRVNDPDDSTALAAGGFMIMHRSLHDRVGGHEAIKNRVAEDLAMAQNVKKHDGSIRLQYSTRLKTIMYRTPRETINGLTKHPLEGINNSLLLYVLLLSLFVYSFVIPILGVVGLFPAGQIALISAGTMLVLCHLSIVGIHVQLNHSILWTLCTVPAVILYVLITLRAVYQKIVYGGTVWKERVTGQ